MCTNVQTLFRYAKFDYIWRMEYTLKEWLQLEPFPGDVIGNIEEGFSIDLEALRNKMRFMEDTFDVIINQSNFHHLLFNGIDKQTYSSGTIEIEILQSGKLFKRLVGGSTFNILEYAGERGSYFANISKTLTIRNAMLHYPAFGANLNKQIPGVPLQKGYNKSTDKVIATLNAIKKNRS